MTTLGTGRGRRPPLCFWVALCAALLVSAGCGGEGEKRELIDAPVTSTDIGAGDVGMPPLDAAAEPDGDGTPDAATPVVPVDAGADASGDMAPTPGVVDAGAGDEDDEEPPSTAAFERAMTYATVNIGRNYGRRADVVGVIDRVGDVIGGKAGPKFIGWQEIGEGDPCGGRCEIEVIRARFAESSGWDTRRPRGTRPDGGRERVKVPVTAKGASVDSVRAVFASPGWAGVSPTRFVTVVHYADRNVSIVNTHLIAGAWSCKSNVARRRDYWRRGWRTLKAEVAREHDRGRNVIVTGDLNRPRGSNDCNPSWQPKSLHPRAKVVGGAGIDYVFAVPAAGQKFAVASRANGTKKRGAITLGIDSHKGHWVRGRFLPR